MKQGILTASICLCMTGITLCLTLAACTEIKDHDTTTEVGLDCPGVDGIYYYVMIPLDDCANRGVTLLDDGMPVEDHGVIMMTYTNCSQTVSYNGCSIEIEIECPLGLSVSLSQTFKAGDPNQVTGTQEQRVDGAQECVYEIFGSTDREMVLEHAGLPDTVDVSDLSTPGTPNPDNLAAASDECNANVAAEEAVCPSGNDHTWLADICTEDWQSFDARGCGDGRRAYINCRTENAADMNCDTGEIPVCGVYLNAYFQCTSAFAASTGCSVAGDPESLCADGLGTYSYGCMGEEPPFADCNEAAMESSVAMYCCF